MSSWFSRWRRFFGLRPDDCAQFAAAVDTHLPFSQIAAHAQKLGAAGLLYQGRSGQADVWLLLNPTDTFERRMLVGHPEFLLAYGDQLIKTDGAAMPSLLTLHRRPKKARVKGVHYEAVISVLDDLLNYPDQPWAPSFGPMIPPAPDDGMRIGPGHSRALKDQLQRLLATASDAWQTFSKQLTEVPASDAPRVRMGLERAACERLLPQPPNWKLLEYRRRGVLLHQALAAGKVAAADEATLRMVREKPIRDAAGKEWPLSGIDLLWIVDSWELCDAFSQRSTRQSMEKLAQDFFGDRLPLTAGRAAVMTAQMLVAPGDVAN